MPLFTHIYFHVGPKCEKKFWINVQVDFSIATKGTGAFKSQKEHFFIYLRNVIYKLILSSNELLTISSKNLGPDS